MGLGLQVLTQNCFVCGVDDCDEFLGGFGVRVRISSKDQNFLVKLTRILDLTREYSHNL